MSTAMVTTGRSINTVLWLLIGALILSNILWVLTDGTTRITLTILGVIFFFSFSLGHLWSRQGTSYALTFLAIVLVLTWAVEAIGVATGLPFGAYVYSDDLGWSLLDVPLLIPMAWFMMAYPCWLIGRAATNNLLGRIALSVTLLVGWDLFLEPQMVGEGYWDWLSVASIPLSNYVGWLLTALVLMIVLHSLPARTVSHFDPHIAVTLLWVYGSNVLAGAVFFGRPAQSLLGAVVMGIPIAVWLMRTRPFQRPDPTLTSEPVRENP